MGSKVKRRKHGNLYLPRFWGFVIFLRNLKKSEEASTFQGSKKICQVRGATHQAAKGRAEKGNLRFVKKNIIWDWPSALYPLLTKGKSNKKILECFKVFFSFVFFGLKLPATNRFGVKQLIFAQEGSPLPTILFPPLSYYISIKNRPKMQKGCFLFFFCAKMKTGT